MERQTNSGGTFLVVAFLKHCFSVLTLVSTIFGPTTVPITQIIKQGQFVTVGIIALWQLGVTKQEN